MMKEMNQKPGNTGMERYGDNMVPADVGLMRPHEFDNILHNITFVILLFFL